MLKTVNFLETIVNSTEPSVAVVRRSWINENRKGQISVQFIQRIKVESSASTNMLVAKAQGIKGAGTNLVTALMSFTEEAFESMFGHSDYVQDYTSGEAPTVNSVFDEELISIEVTDSWYSNEYSQTHEARINPRSGDNIQVEGKDIYRHTELAIGEAVHSFDVVSGRKFPRNYTPKKVEVNDSTKEVETEKSGLDVSAT